MDTKKKVTVAYCRTACEQQGRHSAKYQARKILRAAKQRGIEVSRVYMDPAKSGNTLNRPALRKLLAECRAGKIDTVIVRDKERLARCILRQANILRQLYKYRVRVELPDGTEIGDDPFSRTVSAAVAELREAETRKKRRNNKTI